MFRTTYQKVGKPHTHTHTRANNKLYNNNKKKMKKLGSFGFRSKKKTLPKDPEKKVNFEHTCYLKKHPEYPPRGTVTKVSWSVVDSHYKPVEFTHKIVLENDSSKKQGGWADPELTPALVSEIKANRVSNAITVGGEVPFGPDMVPRNPLGRTGMIGRGLLGKWGPNQAADPIVTRFHPDTGRLQVVVILRKDVNEWALPGGMVDPGELITLTLKREFLEEAGQDPDPDNQKELKEKLDDLFTSVGNSADDFAFVGYVDDVRNTDNSWMETVAVHYHISDKFLAENLELSGRDDALKAKWVDVDDSVKEFKHLYSNHRLFVILALRKNEEAWASTLAKIDVSEADEKGMALNSITRTTSEVATTSSFRRMKASSSINSP